MWTPIVAVVLLAGGLLTVFAVRRRLRAPGRVRRPAAFAGPVPSKAESPLASIVSARPPITSDAEWGRLLEESLARIDAPVLDDAPGSEPGGGEAGAAGPRPAASAASTPVTATPPPSTSPAHPEFRENGNGAHRKPAGAEESGRREKAPMPAPSRGA